MKKENRLEYLEGIRGFLAVYVLIHHYVHCRNELAFLQRYFIFGQVSVLIFFLLSGFVIYYSMMSRKPDMSWREYFMARFRRIYPIFILAMITNYLLLALAKGTWPPFDLDQFLMNLLQVQDDNHAWYIVFPYQNNHPLWSLSYEWWFYMLFYPLQRVFRKQPDLQKYIVAGFSAINVVIMTFYPNGMSIYFAYWILWFAGVEMAREYMQTGKVSLARQAIPWGLVACVGALWLLPRWIDPLRAYPQNLQIIVNPFPGLQLRHFASVFVVLIFGYAWYKVGMLGFKYVVLPFHHLASFSYALYVVHLPFIHTSMVATTGSIIGDMLIYIPLTMLTAYLWERKLQPVLNKYLR